MFPCCGWEQRSPELCGLTDVATGWIGTTDVTHGTFVVCVTLVDTVVAPVLVVGTCGTDPHVTDTGVGFLTIVVDAGDGGVR